MGIIRQLKNWFTKQNIYPQTVEQAIYDSEGRRLDNKIANGLSNPNILINADFRNPVNQRGQTVYSNGYSIDRWIASSTCTITVKDGCIGATNTDANTFIYQKIEFPKSYIGRTLTLTFSTSNGLYSITKTIPSQFDGLIHNWYGEERDGVCASIYIDSANSLCFTLECRNTNGGNIDIYWAKLEEGEIATPFRPRLYEEELLLCKRYYQAIEVVVENESYYTDNLLRFFINHDKMRIRPTPSILSNKICIVGVSKNSAVPYTDFDISIANAGDAVVVVSATKTNHGISNKARLALNSGQTGSFILLDAEL